MKHWIYPANPKYYDVISAFTQEDETAWTMSSKVEVGDYVYIYSGQPFKQVLFKCEVLDINLPPEAVMEQAKKYIKAQGASPKKNFMLVKTIHEFEVDPLGPLSFGVLKQHGLKGSIMGPQCLENNLELFNYIKTQE